MFNIRRAFRQKESENNHAKEKKLINITTQRIKCIFMRTHTILHGTVQLHKMIW